MADARFVLSDSGERESPKNAPQIIAAANKPGGKPIAKPVAISASPIVAMDVKDEPVEVAIIAVTRQAAGINIAGLINSNA